MSDPSNKSGRNPLRHLGVMAALGAVIVVAAFVTLTVLSDQKHALVVRTWEQGLGSAEDLLERYPGRSVNDSALRVEELGATLGIDLAPRWAQGRARPTDAARMAYRAVLPHHYLQAQVERAGSTIDEPPAEFVDFVRRHALVIEALREHLVTGEPPRWEFTLDTDDVAGAALPNLLGHITMQKLLLADALARAHAGDHPDALRSVEASWRLGSAIDDDPVLIAQLIAIAGARLRCGVLRKLRDVPEVWRDRLLEQDYRASFFDAMKLEGWYWLQIADSHPVELAREALDMPLIFESALGWVARPYVRASAADVAEEWHRQLARLSRLEYLCDRDLSGDLELATAWWNYIGRSIPVGIPFAPSRLARLEVDTELTARILAARAALERAADTSPQNAVRAASRACPQDHWIYRHTPAGGLSIALSRTVEWPEDSGPVLPTRFTIEPR